MKLALVFESEEKKFQRWFTEHQGDLNGLKLEDISRQAFLAGLSCSQSREKLWQVASGKLAVIANRMYGYVDERNLSESDSEEVHKMHEFIHKYLDFDEHTW